MSGRMPILRQDDVRETSAKPINDRYNFIAARYAKRTVRTKIVLDVDDYQSITVADCVSCNQFCLPSMWSLFSANSFTAVRFWQRLSRCQFYLRMAVLGQRACRNRSSALASVLDLETFRPITHAFLAFGRGSGSAALVSNEIFSVP
jgi:hypothetical protein